MLCHAVLGLAMQRFTYVITVPLTARQACNDLMSHSADDINLTAQQGGLWASSRHFYPMSTIRTL